MLKRWSLVVLCIGLAWMLSACTTPLPSETQPQEEKILLTALFGESTSDPGVSDMLYEKIKQNFPQVDLEWECVDWGEQFSKRLNVKIASGETPDLIIGKAQDVQAYHAIDALGAFPEEFGQLLTDQGVIASTVNGQLFGLTYNQLYQGVLYNKNIFYRYNFSVPETPEELEKIVNRLESVGITPFATHYQETWYTGNILMQFALNEVFSQVPDWGDQLRAGKASFSQDEAYKRCCQQVLYQLEHSWKDSLGLAQSESDQRFAMEEAAMYLTGSWSVQTLQSIAPFRSIGIFPYPNQAGNARLIVEPNTTLMKSADTKYDDLVNQIYRSILTDESLTQTLCAFTQTQTTVRGVDVEDSLAMISDDMQYYKQQGRLINASTGNNQLVWAYQYNCAASLMDYLTSKKGLPEILESWDDLRQESRLQP
jgi:ABC-type glycerol-3-phosphate transport system substrate-binding protein